MPSEVMLETHEVKLCTVVSAEGRDGEGTPVRDAGSVSSFSSVLSRRRFPATISPGLESKHAIPICNVVVAIAWQRPIANR